MNKKNSCISHILRIVCSFSSKRSAFHISKKMLCVEKKNVLNSYNFVKGFSTIAKLNLIGFFASKTDWKRETSEWEHWTKLFFPKPNWINLHFFTSLNTNRVEKKSYFMPRKKQFTSCSCSVFLLFLLHLNFQKKSFYSFSNIFRLGECVLNFSNVNSHRKKGVNLRDEKDTFSKWKWKFSEI